MKKLLTTLTTGVLSLSLSMPLFAQCNSTTAEHIDAQDVAARYADALINGNTTDLLAILETKLREEKAPLLTKEGYWQQLANHYEGANYTVSDCATMPDGKVQATVSIQFPAGDNSNIKLLMDNFTNDGLLIYSEIFLN